MICVCTGNGGKTQAGWTQRDDDEMWVCGSCRLPTRGFLESYMARKSEETPPPTYLNLLVDGPLHHKLLTNAEFMTRDRVSARDDATEILAHASEYRWTPEIVYGSESGKPARVWKWKEPADG